MRRTVPLGPQGKNDRRRIATKLFNEQCAIAILANLPERLNSRERLEQIDALQEKTSRELKDLVSALRTNIQAMRLQFGVKLNRDELLLLLDDLHQNTSKNHACYVPVWHLSKWLSKYDALGLAPHCRISIDPHCIGRDYPGGFEIRMLEVTMFEDMASLFNLAREAYLQTSTARSPSKVALKGAVALYRATASAAFYFIESFMNELAIDYVWNHREQISSNDLTRLTEWDEQRQRQKFVSTRDKLVLYPRIITGSEYPILDEVNCPELKLIVGKAKDLRDAIVHASTAKKDEEGEYEKESAIMGLTYQATEEIVDAAVGLIRKIQATTSSVDLPWLFDRSTDGFFPKTVFD
jgi:hypothetical protein